MTTDTDHIIKIDLEEVYTKHGKTGLIELTDADDLFANGLGDYSVDVIISDDGSWDITKVYATVSKYAPGGPRKLIEGPRSIEYARALERIKQNYIQDKVRSTIMQSDRSEFPGARVA
jgi:hypothetical protein